MNADPHRLARLRGCHPFFVEKVTLILETLASEGHIAIVTQGVRTLGQQRALYNIGRTKPGKVVTNCDGVYKVSAHQPQADGYGYAADFAWRVNSDITWEGPWTRLGTLARRHGLIWGGAWAGFKDRPHLELPRAPTAENR